MPKYGTPKYQHDCECCVFLGTLEDTTSVQVYTDMYFHKSIHSSTIIARYSSDGPDYTSGMAFAFSGNNPALTLAVARAFRDGLLTPEDCVKEGCG